jgi:hypothetical protein
MAGLRTHDLSRPWPVRLSTFLEKIAPQRRHVRTLDPITGSAKQTRRRSLVARRCPLAGRTNDEASTQVPQGRTGGEPPPAAQPPLQRPQHPSTRHRMQRHRRAQRRPHWRRWPRRGTDAATPSSAPTGTRTTRTWSTGCRAAPGTGRTPFRFYLNNQTPGTRARFCDGDWNLLSYTQLAYYEGTTRFAAAFYIVPC